MIINKQQIKINELEILKRKKELGMIPATMEDVNLVTGVVPKLELPQPALRELEKLGEKINESADTTNVYAQFFE